MRSLAKYLLLIGSLILSMAPTAGASNKKKSLCEESLAFLREHERIMGTLEDFWGPLETAWQASTKRVISANPQIYLEGNSPQDSPSNVGDKILLEMRNEGFQFEPQIEIPSLTSIMRAHRQQIADHVESGRYKPEDFFLYAKLFENIGTNELLAVPEGMPEPSTADYKPHDGAPTGNGWIRYLWEGYQIVGLPNTEMNYGSFMNFTMHDHVHLRLLNRNPEYSRALRRQIRIFQNERIDSYDENDPWLERISHAAESLELVNPKKWPEIKTKIRIPERPDGHIYDVNEVLRHLQKLQKDSGIWSIKVAQRDVLWIRDHFNEIVEPFGGSAGDPGTKYNGTGMVGSMGLNLLRQVLSDKMEGEIDLRNLAELYTFLANFHLVDAATWVEESFQKDVTPEMKIHQLMVRSLQLQAEGKYDKAKAYGLELLKKRRQE